MRPTCLAAAALLIIAGCGPARSESSASAASETGEPQLDHRRFSPIRLQGRLLASGAAFGSPHQVFVISDSTLIVLDDFVPFVHVVSRASGGIVASFGNAGQGPGEFTEAASITRDPSVANRIWIYDPIRSRMHRFNLNRPDSGADSVLGLPRAPRMESPVWISRGRVAGLARADSTALAFWQPDSGKLETRGTGIGFANMALDSLVAEARDRIAGSIKGCYEPSKSSFVRVHRSGARVEIVRLPAGDVVPAESPFSFAPLMWSDPDIGGALTVDAGNANQRVSYVACTTSDNYIMALFSGRRRGSFATPDVYLSHFIHVFSWTGKLVGVLELDEPVIGLAVDMRAWHLFGVRRHPVPSVYRFDIRAAVESFRP